MINEPKDRILVALDYDNAADALALAQKLAGKVGGVKVGLELVNAAGFDIFEQSLQARAHLGYMPENVPLYNDMRVTEYCISF